jgi:uncharacterized protein involved in type VI secretion and phage assembly
MAGEAVSFGATQEFKKREPEQKIYGVTVCQVLNVIDCMGGARVQLSLPWLPGVTPWARLSNQMAGMAHGSFFVPVPGTEVLVAFNHGDVREPFVLGSLWNPLDRPPALSPTDAVTKRKIRTPLGHELAFDEALQSVTLSNNTMSTLTLDPLKAEISTPTAKVTIGKLGDVTIKSATKLTLDAPIIEIKATGVLAMKSEGAALFKANGVCAVRGTPVKLN